VRQADLCIAVTLGEHAVMPRSARCSEVLGRGLDGSVLVRDERGDRMVTAMSGALPVPDAPAVSVAGAIARMEAIARRCRRQMGWRVSIARTWT
jgi:hypothetical protein